MTLKRKMASILLLIMAISSLVYFAVFKFIVFKNFVEAENNDAIHDMHQCISVLNHEIKHLDRFVHDWSSWDSAYQFATDRNPEFIDENLKITVYLDQGISLMHFYDRDSRLVWGKTYDLETEEEIPLDLAKELNAALFLKLITQKDPEKFTSGIIQTSIGPMLIAAHPILTSENKGPSHGVLVMGRLFNRDFITLLYEQTGVALEAWPVRDQGIPEDVKALIHSLNDPASVRLVHASSDILHAYSIVEDIDDRPAIILKATFPRLITQKGTKAYIVGMVFILGAGLLVFISISGILGAYVLDPIARLTEKTLAIGVTSTNPDDFDTGRKDEIGTLSREFAAMVERLSVSEKLYRILAENTRDTIWVSDLDLHSSYVSPSVMQLLGYTPEEAMKQSLDEFLTPESYKFVREVLERELALELSGQPHGPEWSYTAEVEMFCKDGSTVWTEVVVSILYNEKGEAEGFIGVTRDIAERKREEADLKQRTDAIELAIDGIAILDEKEKYIYLNRAHATIYGYSDANELIGKSWRILYESDELQRFAQTIMPDLYQKGYWRGEAIGKKADGAQFPQYLSLTVLDSGGLICVVRDITENKKVEETLKQRTDAIETAVEGIALLNKRAEYIYLNRAQAHLYGYSDAKELLGKSWSVLYSPDEIQRFNREIIPGLYNNGHWHGEATGKKVDGNEFPSYVSLTVLDNGGVISVTRDMTELKAVEEELRKSEAYFRALTENSSELVTVIEEDGTIRYESDSCKRVLGYEPEELVGKNALEYIHPDDLQKAADALFPDPAYITKAVSVVLRFRHKDGSWLLLEADGRDLRDHSAVKGIVINSRDVTLRRQAEDAIKKSEERYRTIFESTATANIIVAEDTTILMANNNFAKLTGYSKQELEGKMSWTAFTHKDDLEKMKSYHTMRRVNPGSAPSSYEFRFINREGNIGNLFMNVAVIPGTKDSVSSIIDITDWKHSEQARIESEARFQQLAELLPEVVYETDTRGVLTFVNKASSEKFGYTQEEFFSGMSVFDVTIPADHQRVRIMYQRIIQGENVGLTEYTASRKDGSTFPVLVNATAIYRDGKLEGSRGFIVDISERKILENQLVKARKMEAIGTLAGGIAHDFNNLLMGILGNISLILLQIDQKHPIYDRLKNVEGYVQSGSDLTKQLLGFARGGKYEVKPTDLGEFIQESSELFGRTKKEIRIHHKTQDGLWTVEVDRGQMEQVLLNLYVNAWHAMPHGGDLYLSEENVDLDSVTVSPHEIAPGKFVKVTVTDTGIGMDELTKARIFEPFFTTREQGRGTGLGLASAYGVIKNHGGFIHVESEKEIGTSFMIYLPVSDKDVDHDRKVEEELHKGKESVLLIDDEEMILEVSTQMLEELGYEVSVSSGGKMGVQTYEQNKDRIDLVILDMIMPDVGGREAFDMLFRINPSVKVLLSSGYSLDGQAKEIMQRGCRGFIQKPFSMTDLSRKIREILDNQ